MVNATTSENTQNSGQPMPIAAPPTLHKPTWKEVTPPAKMQMIDMVSAKLANSPISRGGAG